MYKDLYRYDLDFLDERFFQFLLSVFRRQTFNFLFNNFNELQFIIMFFISELRELNTHAYIWTQDIRMHIGQNRVSKVIR